MSTNFDYCDCQHCNIVKQNSLNDVWIHEGCGNYTKQWESIQPQSIQPGTIIQDFFDQPKSRNRFNGFNDSYVTCYSKPNGVIWFSNGSWLFDSYSGVSHDDPLKEYKVAVVRSPKNILSIETNDDLEWFIDTYNFNKKWENGLLGFLKKKNPWNAISWDAISNDGYWGISFGFRKIKHIYDFCNDENDLRYRWHYLFDVESLCIFDTRAIDFVSIETITI